PDDTTLIRWANLSGSETVAQLNDRVVDLARQRGVTRGPKLRVDSTVVETNIHHPTDSRLVGDGVRVLSRLLRRTVPREEAGRLLARLRWTPTQPRRRPWLRRHRGRRQPQHRRATPTDSPSRPTRRARGVGCGVRAGGRAAPRGGTLLRACGGRDSVNPAVH